MTDFSYQLYSSRNFAPMSDTLRMLADAGYAQVEGYGALFEQDATIDALAGALSETGLKMPTAHIGLDMMKEQSAKVLGIADRFAMRAIFGPYLADTDRPTDREGWIAFGQTLAEIAKPYWDAGLAVGWHNHDFEFVDIDGTTPQALLLEADDRLALELDTAWVVKGGHDPVAWIKEYGSRVVSAHIKDIATPGEKADEDGWADVGHGTIEWAPIVQALKDAGTSYFIMEHDNPSDDKRFASQSLASAKALWND
ncbi:MAG: sugar phosphate isomerase/epimerase [Pseudomonadota bacterium]